MIYDDVVRETLIEPLPEQPAGEAPVDEPDPPVTGHDAIACPTCQAWLEHVRDTEHP